MSSMYYWVDHAASHTRLSIECLDRRPFIGPSGDNYNNSSAVPPGSACGNIFYSTGPVSFWGQEGPRGFGQPSTEEKYQKYRVGEK